VRNHSVSFVIPTRNQAPFIERCIDGCIEQAVPDSEIIVVDGCSTDGTQGILATYGSQLRWLSEPDQGQSDALNKGVKLAGGEVIAWINSDDYYPSAEIVRQIVSIFKTDPKMDIVYGDGLVTDANEKPLRKHRSWPVQRPQQILIHPSSFVMQPAVFFRRDLFLQVGGADPTLHFALDYELWLRMFTRARTCYLPQVLACARYHPAAKTIRNMSTHIRELVRVKARYASVFRLSPSEWARMAGGVAVLYLYFAAVKLRLYRAA